MLKIIFLAITSILFALISTALFGIWSNVFIFSFGAFTFAYWGSQRDVLLAGAIVMILYEIILGQAPGDFVVTFIFAFIMFSLFCRFVQISPFAYTKQQFKDFASFLFVAVLAYLFFTISGIIWKFMLNGSVDIYALWLIDDPVGYFLTAIASFIINAVLMKLILGKKQ